MQTWYTADWHFSHHNILAYCNRPYATVDEMNAALVANYKARVNPEDRVYVLGDCAWRRDEATLALMESLPGRKVLVRGNHDSAKVYRSRAWEAVYATLQVEDHGRPVMLAHVYPADDRGLPSGYMYLHGHSHGKRPYASSRVVDVGVDCWNYYPVTLDEILKAQRQA